MGEILIIALVVVAWILVNRLVLPKFGIPT